MSIHSLFHCWEFFFPSENCYNSFITDRILCSGITLQYQNLLHSLIKDLQGVHKNNMILLVLQSKQREFSYYYICLMNLWACKNVCSTVWIICCCTWIITISILINEPYSKKWLSNLNQIWHMKLTNWINYWRNQLHGLSHAELDYKWELTDHENVWVTMKENCTYKEITGG